MNSAGAPPIKFKKEQLDCTVCKITSEGKMSCTCKVPVQKAPVQKCQPSDDLCEQWASSHYGSGKVASPSEDPCKDARIKFDLQKIDWTGKGMHDIGGSGFDLSDPVTRACHEYCATLVSYAMKLNDTQHLFLVNWGDDYARMRDRCVESYAGKNAQSRYEHSVLRTALTLVYRISSLTSRADLKFAASHFLDVGKALSDFNEKIETYWREKFNPNNVGQMIRFTEGVQAKVREAIDRAQAKLNDQKVTVYFHIREHVAICLRYHQQNEIEEAKERAAKAVGPVLKSLGLNVDLKLSYGGPSCYGASGSSMNRGC